MDTVGSYQNPLWHVQLYFNHNPIPQVIEFVIEGIILKLLFIKKSKK